MTCIKAVHWHYIKRTHSMPWKEKGRGVLTSPHRDVAVWHVLPGLELLPLHDALFPQQGQFTNPETPGYVGFANLPNQVHRKSVKKGFEFTLMVVGEFKTSVSPKCYLQSLNCMKRNYFEALLWCSGCTAVSVVVLQSEILDVYTADIMNRVRLKDTTMLSCEEALSSVSKNQDGPCVNPSVRQASASRQAAFFTALLVTDLYDQRAGVLVLTLVSWQTVDQPVTDEKEKDISCKNTNCR